MTKPRKPGALEKWIGEEENRGVGRRNGELLRILRAAKRDRDRLDWLERPSNFDEVIAPMKKSQSGPGWTTWWAGPDKSDKRKSLRAAIDAAMKAGRGK